MGVEGFESYSVKGLANEINNYLSQQICAAGWKITRKEIKYSSHFDTLNNRNIYSAIVILEKTYEG
jgi:hypothetical protein